MSDTDRLLPRKILDVLNLGVILLIVVVQVALVGLSYVQAQALQRQNDVQLCAQHDILTALIGVKRNLGLPTNDIHPPDVSDISCPGDEATQAMFLRAPRCSISGTERSDQLNGTARRDVICALRGDDYAQGRAAPDIVRGGRGADTLVGGSGADILRGRGGADNLFATDGSPGDQVIGGLGRDNCYGDAGDIFEHCEHVVTV